MHLKLKPFFAACIFATLACTAFTQVAPSGMTYQGRLTDSSGAPVPDGTGYEIEVRLWSASTGGNLLWGTRYAGVSLKNGTFNLILGSGGTAITGATSTDLKAAFNTPTVHLGLTATKSATGAIIPTPTEILPRQQIFSTPYAFKAEMAATVAVNSIDLASLKAKVVESLTPAGSVLSYVGMSAPQGWLLCDGAAVSRQQYSALFAIMGTSHGSGDGSTTFNLPDYRGRFLRGVDGPDGGNADRDPDSARRQAASPGGNTSGLGSVQEDELKGHRHQTVALGATTVGDLINQEQSIASVRAEGHGGLHNNNFEYEIGGNTSEPTIGRTSATEGLESRPKNSAVNFIIKY